MKKVIPISLLLGCIFLLAGCNIGAEPVADEILIPLEITDEVTATEEVTQEIEAGTSPVEVADNSNATSPDTASNSISNTGGSNTATTNTTSTTNTSASACVSRTDWPTYEVVAGDTLSAIAGRTGSSVPTLVQANCLDNRDTLFVGQALYVPQAPRVATAVVTNPNTTSSSDDCVLSIPHRTEILDSPQGTNRTVLGFAGAGETYTPVLHFEGLPYWGVWWNGGIVWLTGIISGDCSDVPRNAEDIDIIIGDGPGAGPSDTTCRVEAPDQVMVYTDPDVGSLGRYIGAGSHPVYERTANGWWNLSADRTNEKWTQLPPIGNCRDVALFDETCTFIATRQDDVFSERNLQSEVVYNVFIGGEHRVISMGGEWLDNQGYGGVWVEISLDNAPVSSGYVKNLAGVVRGECTALIQ